MKVSDLIVYKLSSLGINYLLGGAPGGLIRALSLNLYNDGEKIKSIMTPHEQTAVAMAHGFYLAKGVMAAVYLYSTVGTANGLCGIINAFRARVPMIIISVTSPISNRRDVNGSKDISVQWAQASFDQNSLVREYVKWDAQILRPDEVDDILDRAWRIAMSPPKGPVYISLSREILSMEAPSVVETAIKSVESLDDFAPARESIHKALAIIAGASQPVVITSSAASCEAASVQLKAFVEQVGAAVIEVSPTVANLDGDHKFHLGYTSPSEMWEHIQQADVLIVIESPVPWFPARTSPNPRTKIIEITQDPLYLDYPRREVRADVTLHGNVVLSLAHLNDALEEINIENTNDVRSCQPSKEAGVGGFESLRHSVSGKMFPNDELGYIRRAWLSTCIREAIPRDALIVNEYPIDLNILKPRADGRYFGIPPSGGLGWGLGASLGAKLAVGEDLVVCAVGDGAYHFGVPTSFHQVSNARNLPVLVILYDNGGWGEAKKAMLSVSQGEDIDYSIINSAMEFAGEARYGQICEAFNGVSFQVSRESEVVQVLLDAVDILKQQKKQILVHILGER